jgi:hypothetical protein
MSDCISLPSFDPRFRGSLFPSLSDCGKVNRGRIGGEMMRAAVSKRRPPDRAVGGIGAAEGGKVQLRR